MFDKYGVDLVLNGHDHTYARGHVPVKNTDNNKSSDFNTLYVTSVSGPKQYKIGLDQLEDYGSDGYIVNKTAEQTQFFQVITIDNEKLIYTAYTVLGDEYDSAIIKKDFSTGKKSLE